MLEGIRLPLKKICKGKVLRGGSLGNHVTFTIDMHLTDFVVLLKVRFSPQ